MPTWKQINESGGTYILRAICAVIALVTLYGFAVMPREKWSYEKWGTFAGAMALFGGYALFGNRMKVKDGQPTLGQKDDAPPKP